MTKPAVEGAAETAPSPLVDENNYARICLYLLRCTQYTADPDDLQEMLLAAYALYERQRQFPDAIRVAMMMGEGVEALALTAQPSLEFRIGFRKRDWSFKALSDVRSIERAQTYTVRWFPPKRHHGARDQIGHARREIYIERRFLEKNHTHIHAGRPSRRARTRSLPRRT